MATKRISALTAASAAALTDQIPIEDASSATKKLTLTQAFALVANTGFTWTQAQAFGAGVTMASTLGVTGAVVLSSTLSAGASTLSSLSVGGTSALTGAVTMASTLAVTGASTLTGAATLGSTMAVTGASTLTGAVAMASTLGVTGVSTLTGGAIVVAAPTLTGSYSLGLRANKPTTWYGSLFEAAGNPASSASNAWIAVGGFAETDAGSTFGSTNFLGLRGFSGSVKHLGTGTVTGAAAVYAGSATKSAGGVITNNYGVFIDVQTVGVNNWGLYSAAAQNQFAGKLGIGMTPVNTLDVTGTFGATGAATLGSTLAVTGASTLTGAVTMASTLGVTGLVTLTGGVVLYSAPTVFTNYGLGLRREITSTASPRVGAAFELVANPTASASSSFFGTIGYAEMKAGNGFDLSASTGGLVGVRGLATHAGSGTIAAAVSLFSGSISSTGGGIINNAYGLYIQAQTAATNNWGVYQLGTTTPNLFAGPLVLGSTTGPIIKSGTGSPEGVETAGVGSLFLSTNGGAGTTLYAKTTGAGNTGWSAVA